MLFKAIAHRKNVAMLLCYNSLATICQIFCACSISFWAQNKLQFIQYLLAPANTFLSLNDFRFKYKIDPRLLSICGLISAVESPRTNSNFQNLQNSNYDQILRKVSKGTQSRFSAQSGRNSFRKILQLKLY